MLYNTLFKSLQTPPSSVLKKIPPVGMGADSFFETVTMMLSRGMLLVSDNAGKPLRLGPGM